MLLLVITPAAAPIAAVPDLASPLAVAVWVPLLVASSATSPLADIPVPKLINACVVWLIVATATAASKASLPPAAPDVAWVSLSTAVVAVRSMSRTPARPAPVPIRATAAASMRLSATDTPTPTLPPEAPPVVVGKACATAFTRSSAVRETSPPPICSVAPSPTSARLAVLVILRASEAAMPTLLPPAPDSAFAASSCWVSPATSVMVALIAMPLAWILALSPTLATVADVTWLTEAAAPIPTCAVFPTAVPSDWALASVLPLAVSSNASVVDTVRPVATDVLVLASMTLTATAAATDTLPSLDEAEALPPVALPVAVCCFVLPTLACVCWVLP